MTIHCNKRAILIKLLFVGSLPLSCQNQKGLAFAISIDPGQPALECSLTRLDTVGSQTSRDLLFIH